MLNRASLRDICSGKHLSQGYTFGETRIPRVMCSGNTRHGGTHITVTPDRIANVRARSKVGNVSVAMFLSGAAMFLRSNAFHFFPVIPSHNSFQ